MISAEGLLLDIFRHIAHPDKLLLCLLLKKSIGATIVVPYCGLSYLFPAFLPFSSTLHIL